MTSAWLKLRWFFAYWISRVGLTIGRNIPAKLLYKLSDPFALFAFYVLHRQRRNLTRNLATVIGPAKARNTARIVFRNFARYIIDFYKLPSQGQRALWRRVDFHDWQKLDEALETEKGTIFVTLHLGQAELGAAALSAYGRSVSVVAETFKYAPMNGFLQDLRKQLGMKIIPAKSSKPDLLRCLNRGEVLGLMFDAAEAGSGVTVDFLGKPAEFSATPARLALRTGARVLPAVVSRRPGKEDRFLTEVDFELDFTPTGDDEADLGGLTQAIARSFEPMVRRYADQWFSFSPMWPDQEPRDPKTPAWMTSSLSLATRIGGLLPARIAYSFAAVAGDAAFHFRAQARENVRDNMRHVIGQDASPGEIDQAAREVFRNVTRYYVDLVRLPHVDSDDVTNGWVTIHGIERLREPTSRGRGVVVVGPHFGSPEMGAQAGSILGLNVLVLVEPLQPPSLAETMAQLRASQGAHYETVSVRTVASALRHLRNGGVLGITSDRDIQGTGLVTEFFGQQTRIPTGAIELAARSRAELVPAFSLRHGAKIDLYFQEPILLEGDGRDPEEVANNLRALLAVMEENIKRDPGQWIVLERIWDPTKLPEAELASPEPASEDGLDPETGRQELATTGTGSDAR